MAIHERLKVDEKTRLNAQREHNSSSPQLVELPAASKPTSLTPESRVTDVTQDKEQIEAISSEILAQRFVKFLSEEKGENEATANKFGELLAEFIDGKVPEIAAIQSLRELMSTDYQLPTKTYTQAKAADPSLTPLKWFDEAYKQGAAMGGVNVQTISKNDASFPTTFRRANTGGLSLGETIEASKEAKYQACQMVLGSSRAVTYTFLEKVPSGKPTHKKQL